jgi:hypothetical protein
VQTQSGEVVVGMVLVIGGGTADPD